MSLTIGDVIELVGIGALAAACFFYLGVPLCLLAVGLGCLYEAQCYQDELPSWRNLIRRLRRHSPEDAADRQ
jgi:hypothetical protein